MFETKKYCKYLQHLRLTTWMYIWYLDLFSKHLSILADIFMYMLIVSYIYMFSFYAIVKKKPFRVPSQRVWAYLVWKLNQVIVIFENLFKSCSWYVTNQIWNDNVPFQDKVAEKQRKREISLWASLRQTYMTQLPIHQLSTWKTEVAWDFPSKA